MTSRAGSRRSGRTPLSTEPDDPGADSRRDAEAGIHGADDVDERAPASARRPSIRERAARRGTLDERGRDRYDSLLRHLQAGRELPVQPRRGRRWRFGGLDIDPSGPRLVALALIVAIGWGLASLVVEAFRRDAVDTWSGPDATVQSGQRLPSCPGVIERPDVAFPSWIRFDGRVYAWTDSAIPLGDFTRTGAYEPTPYRHRDLNVLRVENTDEGRSGRTIMVRQREAQVGALYRAVEDCS